MNESKKITGIDTDLVGLSMASEEKGNFRFIGEVTDIITYPDGSVEVREGQNIVVNSISRLLACFIKNEPGYMGGSLYWAFGTGQASWDTTPHVPSENTSILVNEVFRKSITSRSFIDTNNVVTTSVTNRLELRVTLGSTEANGHSLREFGIFGGNASATVNSGLMLNHKSHARIDKVEGMQIERIVRFTF